MAQSGFRDEALALYDLSTAIESGSIPQVVSQLSRPIFARPLGSDSLAPRELDRTNLEGRLLLEVAWRAREKEGLLSLGLLLEKGAEVEAEGMMGRWVEWEIEKGEQGVREAFLEELERAREVGRKREKGWAVRYLMRESPRSLGRGGVELM